jgi:hypothetical protein
LENSVAGGNGHHGKESCRQFHDAR